MKRIYEGYLKYAEKRLRGGPNARAMLYRSLAKLGLSAFEPGAKVVWTTGYCFPMAFYWPFGVVPFDFEYAGLYLAAAGRSSEILSASNNLGYPVDTCSAHRTAVGAEALGFFPHADLLISTTHFCDGKPKCNEVFQEKYDVPFPLFSDKDLSIARLLKVTETPTFIGVRFNKDGSQQKLFFKSGGFGNIAQFLAQMLQWFELSWEE